MDLGWDGIELMRGIGVYRTSKKTKKGCVERDSIGLHKGTLIMKIVTLTKEQVEDIENRLEYYDNRYNNYPLSGRIQIGVEDDGKLVAGLDACITAFRILYVSTVFVDEDCRRKGYGRRLIAEMEKKAVAMGVNTIRLDTFSWQGKEFYEAMGYTIVGSYENAADGYAEYFFVKRL